MNVKTAYDLWAGQYDTDHNRTRDLEGIALKKILGDVTFGDCLEIGCGTGKNTEWLTTKANRIMAIDLSDEMLEKAKAKVLAQNVEFFQADINEEWDFAANRAFDVVTFSLVLEHIAHLDRVFENVSKIVKSGGYVYIGELHPFKQYTGTKARFETANGVQVVTCYNHHVSDFTASAHKHGFDIVLLEEFFDDNDRNNIPRILALLLKKAD